MHKYKIDCYFDYLLGNPYDFHAPDEKYSGCLMMGNYQKRKAKDDNDSVRSAEESRKRKRTAMVNDDDADGEGSDSDDDKRKRRAPVLVAGSRKRAKGSILHFDSNPHTEEEEEEGNADHRSENGDDDEHEHHGGGSGGDHQQDEEEEQVQKPSSTTRSKKSRAIVDSLDNDDDEEDELASSSSSGVPSPILQTRPMPSVSTTTQHNDTSSTAGLFNVCENCTQLKEKITSMEREMQELQSKVVALELRVKEDDSSKEQELQRIARLEAIFEHYEKSRTVLADLFAQKPAVLR